MKQSFDEDQFDTRRWWLDTRRFVAENKNKNFQVGQLTGLIELEQLLVTGFAEIV